MQVGIPPLTFLLSALHQLLYNTTIDGQYEIDPYFVRSPISSLKTTRVWADTTLGQIRGVKQISRDGMPYNLFRGIPFAKAPIGELRYEPPQPHGGWDGVLDASYFRSQCLQINVFTRKVVGNEDCLFLNVATRRAYTSSDLPKGDDDLRPVLFFIHGGLFMFGGANPFGSKYFLDEDVVLVSLNYRLNSFGFFNSGDGLVSGNMGLLDQTQGLRWVKDNIRYFNGDPNRVTLIGESAGAACVHLHTLSPLSRGLFAGAISLSGTALSPWGHVDYPGIQAKEYGEGLGCPTEDSRVMVACLKNLTGERVASYHLGYMGAAAQGKQALFGPTVDSGPAPPERKFLPAKPLDLLRTGQISDKPWMGGVNSGDGLVYLIPVLRNETIRRLVAENWYRLAPAILGYQNLNDRDRETLTADISSYYLHNQIGISHEHVNDTGNMFSDRGFFLDNHDVAVMQSQVAPTYVFYYSYHGVFAMADLLFYRTPLPLPNDWNYMLGGGLVWLYTMFLNRRNPRRSMEIFHGDEMPLLFNIPLIRREVGKTDADYEFSKKMISLYVSFAETGVPNPSQVGVTGVNWDPVPKHTFQRNLRMKRDGPLRRLHFDKEFKMIEEPFHERMQFWRRHSISYLKEEEEEMGLLGRYRSSHSSIPDIDPKYDHGHNHGRSWGRTSPYSHYHHDGYPYDRNKYKYNRQYHK